MTPQRLVAIRRVGRNLADFVQLAWHAAGETATYVHGKHIDLIAAHLEAAARGELQPDRVARLLINLPPGAMKSQLVCVYFTVWCWLYVDAGMRFLFASHSVDLANRDSRTCARLITSEWFQTVYGDRFKLTTQRESLIENDRGGARSVSPLDRVVGSGGHIVCVDDPHTPSGVESDAVRNATKRELRESLPSRVRTRNGAMIVIGQRLAETDYFGDVYSNDDPGSYVRLCLPARYQQVHPFPIHTPLIDPATGETFKDWRTVEGEPLFPRLFPDDRLKAREAEQGPYAWDSQWMQRPVNREGAMFKRAWVDPNIVDAQDAAPPKSGRIVRAWDVAATHGAGDWTACVRMYEGTDGKYYVAHVDRFHEDGGTVLTRMKLYAAADGRSCKIRIPQDPAAAGKAWAEMAVRELRGYRVVSKRPEGSKVQRAEPLVPQMALGRIKFIRGPWLQTFLEELLTFPQKTKDQVDALVDAFDELALGAPVYASGQSFLLG